VEIVRVLALEPRSSRRHRRMEIVREEPNATTAIVH
jgi:hypothetical protein